MVATVAPRGNTGSPAPPGAYAGRVQVVALGHALVKGTRHTARDAVELAAGGVVGDRELCLVDVGRRHVLRTVQNPALLAVDAVRAGGLLHVRLPGGETVSGPTPESGETLTCDYWGRPVSLRLLDGPHADALARHLGRPVRLAAAPRGGVVYGDEVSLVTTASLAALAARLDRAAGGLEAARFRANAVLATERPFAEEAWVGREISLGGARVVVTGPVPRCAVPDRRPTTGARDAPVLAALVGLATERGADGRQGPPFGVQARVVEPGVVRSGDRAALLP